MPVSRGQGQPTRWYQFCFVTTSEDSSDDSDTEYVVQPHNASSAWEEELSPLEPLNTVATESPGNTIADGLDPEPETNWQILPPPPPPPPPHLMPSVVQLQDHSETPSSTWEELFPQEQPNTMTTVSARNTRADVSVSSDPPEPEIDWQLHMMPSTSRLGAAALAIESEHDRYEPLSHAVFAHSPLHPFSPIEQGGLPESKSVMNAIRSLKISESCERDKSRCPICMEEFKMGDQARQLPCNHTYCSECIFRWLNNNKTCPVCRLQLDGWEGGSGSRGDNSLIPESEIPAGVLPIPITSSAWEFFFPPNVEVQSPGNNNAGHNSDEAEYDSACDELGDSHEDGDRVGASQSDRG